ncbi:MAG: hypothetical protein HY232_19995 [Acidobacteria bacterium]|nr:hypothetical protein [Acidobacteriota bacterium]
MACSSIETLVSYLEKTLDAASTQAVASHIDSGCSLCKGTLEWLQMVMQALHTNELKEPPRQTVDQLICHFKMAKRKPLWQPIRRLIAAALMFDSTQQLEFSDARSVQGNGKQLLYQAESYDIDIRFTPARPPNTTNIMGQVLPHESDFERVTAILIELYQGDSALLSTLTDHLGVFNLRKVPAGLYDFKIQLPDCILAIHAVSVARP